jgi:hypothetical protein
MALTAHVYWLALRRRVRGVGPRTARLLGERLGTAEQVFRAGETSVVGLGIPGPNPGGIRGFADLAPIERELRELPKIAECLIRCIDPEYPLNLRHFADPLPSSSRGVAAAVGTCGAHEAGRRMASGLA